MTNLNHIMGDSSSIKQIKIEASNVDNGQFNTTESVFNKFQN